MTRHLCSATDLELAPLRREVVERGLPVLLGKGFSEGAPLAEQLQALQPRESLALLAAVHAATRACLTHRRRSCPTPLDLELDLRCHFDCSVDWYLLHSVLASLLGCCMHVFLTQFDSEHHKARTSG